MKHYVHNKVLQNVTVSMFMNVQIYYLERIFVHVSKLNSVLITAICNVESEGIIMHRRVIK